MQFFETDTVKVVSSKINSLKFSNPEKFEDLPKSDIPKMKMMMKKKIGIVEESDIKDSNNRTYLVKFVDFEKVEHFLWFKEDELVLI